MSDEVAKLLKKIENDGVGSVMTGLRQGEHGTNTPIQAAIKEHEYKQQFKRDEMLAKQHQELLAAQRKNNKIQWRIFWVLFATLVLTLIVAVVKD